MSDKFLIKGGIPLLGSVEISGYKNSAGACLAATLLSEKPSIIKNLPEITDVLDQIQILKEMGAKVEWQGKGILKIDPAGIDPEKIPTDLFAKIRLSILLVGPLLARFKKIKIPHPGGDKIGLRPITVHLQALKDFGVKVEEKNGFYHLEAPKETDGKTVILKEFSVSATEIIMMFAALSNGETKIELAAAEPQVQDLGNFLLKMGLNIEGMGTHSITIKGRNILDGAEFSLSPDPLEVGTFLIAFAVTGGEGIIKKTNPKHLLMFLEKLKEIGVNLEISDDAILIKPSLDFRPTKIQTLPFPGFPTDLQPQTSVLLTQAQGKSLIHDPLFENRFQHLHELRKMGADIEITDPHRALIFGKTDLKGTQVDSSDIRAGAALILAGLAAKGETLVNNAHLIDRGYEKFEEKLKSLGANIERV